MKKQWWIVSAGVLTLLLISYLAPEHKRRIVCSEELWTLAGDDFEGFDNVSGNPSKFIVPNYVHFLRIGSSMKTFNFIDTVVVLSALKNQKPEKIYFHTDQTFTGHFWNVLVHTEGFMDVVEFVPTELPDEIYGQPFSKSFHVFHAGDILRIRLLRKYGGIFLDNDSFLVRSMDVFRKFEMVLNWDENQYLGTQILIAHRDARFLQLWENSYKDQYQPLLWYYNAGERPTEVVLKTRPEVIHRVKLLLGVRYLAPEIYQDLWEDWKNHYSVHLLTRHFKYLRNRPFIMPEEFTVDNIHNYANTLREMVKSVFNFSLHEQLLQKGL